MDEKKIKKAIAYNLGLIEHLKEEARILKKEDGRKILIDTYQEQIDICKTIAEALEKQLPKKLEEYHYEEPGEKPYIKYGCGNGCRMQPTRSSKYCNQCGQRIDWSE